MKILLLIIILMLPGLAAAQKQPVAARYTGALQVGKTYRGKVNFGSAYGMTLTPWPKLPYHHSVLYRWTNVKDFPELDPDKDFGVRRIVFRVLGKEVHGVRKNLWITTFTIEILGVESPKPARQ